MADFRRDMRDKAKRASWDSKKIDVSKNIDEYKDKPKFNKEAYDELMAYAKELEKKKKKIN